LPEHCVWPGAHVPEQAPETHVSFTQVVGGPQLPVGSQVWTPFVPPSPVAHCAWVGAQTPTHAPATQVWLVVVQSTMPPY
jgi:hypothetical protein